MSAMVSLLCAHGRHAASGLALVTTDAVCSYSQLDTWSSHAAGHLLRAGLLSGDRVLLHFRNTLQLVIAYYACFRAGVLAVPIGLDWAQHDLGRLLKAIAPAAYLGERTEYVHWLKHIGATALPLAYVSGIGAVTRYARDFVDLLSPLPERPTPPAGTPAVVLHTSGTTATPKSVVHDDQTLLWRARTVASFARQPDIIVLGMPLVHPFGFTTLVRSLAAGATVILVPPFDADAILDAIAKHQATSVIGVPALYYDLITAQTVRPRNTTSLRTCVIGGDVVPITLQRDFYDAFGVGLVTVYGSTEAGLIAIDWRGRHDEATLGYPVPGVAVRLVDDQGHPVDPGYIGELEVRSPGLARGYWSDMTVGSRDDPWLRTGDLASCDPDGLLRFHGRTTEVIVRAGLNVSPQQIEEALLEHPAVTEAAVFGIPDLRLGQSIAACVSLRAGHKVTGTEVRTFLFTRLAPYTIPEHIHIASQLKRTTGGKLDRAGIREEVLRSSLG